MGYESTLVNTRSFLLKSARVSIPSSSGGYVPLGACRDVKLTETYDPLIVEADNAYQVVVQARNQSMTVEGKMLELNWQKIARMRNGVDTFSTATYTFDSGGNLTITPQAVYITSNDAIGSTGTLAITVYYSYCTQPLEIPFPGDDKTDVAEIPFKLKGILNASLTAGQQLYRAVDTRSTTIYDNYSTTTA